MVFISLLALYKWDSLANLSNFGSLILHPTLDYYSRFMDFKDESFFFH